MALSVSLFVAGCNNNLEKAYAEGQRAQALLESGDLAGARAAIGRAISLRDDQLDLLLIDGRIKYQSKEFKAAFDSYSLALAIDPSHLEALQAVSQIGASLGFEQESIDATERLLVLQPGQPNAMLVKGVNALNRRNYSIAEDLGDQMLARDPKSEAGMVLKARAMFQKGERAQALALLSEAEKTIGRTQMISTALLECARDQGDDASMIAQYRLLSSMVPANIDLTVDEANIRYKTGHIAEARERGQALIAENGKDHEAMRRLADLWEEYDPDPLTPTEIARIASEGAPATRMVVARHYIAHGKPTVAADVLAGLYGDEPVGLRIRTAFLIRQEGALREAEKLLEKDRNNCDALAVRAASRLARGAARDSVIDAQTIAAECPDRIDGFVALAAAYDQQGQDAGVRRAFSEGIQAKPLNSRIAAHYVDWLFKKGDKANAVATARRLAQRAPAKLSAWDLMISACQRAGDTLCAADATAGKAEARRKLVVDLLPGQRAANPLLGNVWR